MASVDRRVRYFNGQFLEAVDFTEEQYYHVDRQQRHNRELHTPGVTRGLSFAVGPGNKSMVVQPGGAVDTLGQQLILTETATAPVRPEHVSKTVFLVIAYSEIPDRRAEVGERDMTRWREQPGVTIEENPTDGYIRLAQITVDNAGSITGTPTDLRAGAGVRLGGEVEVNRLTLSRETGAKPALSSGAPGRADVGGSLHVTGNITLAGALTGNVNLGANTVGTSQLANDSVTAAKILDGSVNTGELAVGAVTNDRIANTTINETKLDAATLGKLVTNGNTHDHDGGDGAQIKHSKLARDDGRNPHGTLAADVGALPVTPGAQASSLVTNSSLEIRHSLGGGRAGALIWHGNANANWGLLSIVAPTPTTPPPGTTQFAAVAGVSGIAGVTGVYARATDAGTNALYVDGASFFSGPKVGYVVDTFVNAGEQRLRTGDVVKLKGTSVARYQGADNKIPVAEVSLADTSDDTAVVGIVDREAIPLPGAPDTRVEPDDPTSIQDGGQLLVVTLGAYSHCKADASAVPIEVGDLLTTSEKPGHAKKATDPKLGAIIGKAMEPLADGTGYIAVLVNIQ